jgi:steroid delta-isomerase-like uncharacterized protein
MSEQNKAVARRIAEEVFEGGQLDLADELLDPSFVGHDVAMPEPLRGPQGVKEQAQGYRTAFPDIELTIENQIAEGDFVATSWTARGTHKGDLFGIAPTGKQVTISGVTIDRFKGGKIAEAWDTWDTLGLMQQIGAVPAMAQA